MRRQNKIMTDKLANQRYVSLKVRTESRQLLHVIEQQQLLDCSVQHYMQWLVPNQIRDAVQQFDSGIDLQIYETQEQEIKFKEDNFQGEDRYMHQIEQKEIEMRELGSGKNQLEYYELVEWAQQQQEEVVRYVMQTQEVRVYKVDDKIILEYLINGVGIQTEKNADEKFHDANKRLLTIISLKYELHDNEEVKEIRQKMGDDSTNKYIIEDPRHFKNCNCLRKDSVKRDQKKVLPYCSCLRNWSRQQPLAMRRYIRRNAAKIVMREQETYIMYEFHGQQIEEKKDPNENLGDTQKRLLTRMFTNIQSDFRIEEVLINQKQSVELGPFYWGRKGETLDLKIFSENFLMIALETEKLFRSMIREKFQNRFLQDYVNKMKNLRTHYMSQLREKTIQSEHIIQSTAQVKILMDKLIDLMKHVRFTNLCYRDVTMIYMYILLMRDEFTTLRLILGC